MPPCHRWPGSSGCHSKTWEQHKATENAQNQARQTAGQQNAVNQARTPPGPPKGLNPDGSIPGAAPPPPAAAAPPRTFVPDSGYNNQVGAAKNRWDDTKTDLDTDERNTKFSFGFDDPTNPFSRVNEMKRDFLNRGKSITGNLGARGQLYAGYHGAKLASNQRNESKSNQALRAAYDEALEGIRRSRVGADRTKEEADLLALREAMSRQGL